MPCKIRVLPDHTINKIAAGEVIENPASVVKELVENSIDAESTDICIEIKGGGRQLIRISDNGTGMNSDDAVLCLERHATSKLREVEDIHTLSTMGFRGEAIPSIASISKFNLLTCPASDNKEQTGTMVIVDGGQMVSCKPAARSHGTTIEVKSLFFNVPVRKKFLKSPAIDANEILKTVSLIALGHPHIKFQLISEGKSLLNTNSITPTDPFNDQLKSRIDDVLGKEFVENLSFINQSSDKITLQGGVGFPSYTRHNRSAQYLFINKRGVVSPLVSYAVKEGFGTSIPSGRFPAFVLHLTIPGHWVDVNVHPQKREVRLRQEQVVKELIINSVRDTLRIPDPTFDLPAPAPAYPSFNNSWQPLRAADSTIPEQWSFPPKKAPEAPTTTQWTSYNTTVSAGTLAPSSFTLPQSPVAHSTEKQLSTAANALPFNTHSAPKISATLPGYLLIDSQTDHPILSKGCRYPEKQGLIIIDQKSAHARIIFEKLSTASSKAPPAQQTLLLPKHLELAPHESQLMRQCLPFFLNMGINIKEFGANSFVIDAIPHVFGNSDIDMLISNILNDARSWQEAPNEGESTELSRARKIAQTASRSAVSSNRKLSITEAQILLEQLLRCENPHICPSGKPIFSQITLDDLAKLFQR